MADWILTVPMKIKWEDYEKEIETVKDYSQSMYYRLPYRPKVETGDRCFIVYKEQVRGWMKIMGAVHKPDGFICTTTGVRWPPGYYLARSGPLHRVDGPKMGGFRGLRRYNSEDKQT